VVLNSLPVEKAGDGSAVNQVARQVGAAFGVALIGSILAAVYSSNLETSTIDLSRDQAATAERSITGATSVAAELPASAGSALEAAADNAFEQGTRVALLTIAALMLAGAVVAFCLLRAPPDAPAAASQERSTTNVTRPR
ncbi:MAG: MFS transporter, partial [Acidimicrobiia bacterium]